MRFERFQQLAFVVLLVLFIGSSGHAQSGLDQSADLRDNDGSLTFHGVINDHTIATAGSWEVHGLWTLHLKGASDKADFLAELTMERSDYWFLTTSNPPADPNSLAARNAHTHHVGMTDAIVSALANGFRVSGAATVTGNGSTAPFGTSSTVQVDITGGDLVTYSNLALTFGGDAVKHFGSAPLAGVVSLK
jgi:hypothetical protein